MNQFLLLFCPVETAQLLCKIIRHEIGAHLLSGMCVDSMFGGSFGKSIDGCLARHHLSIPQIRGIQHWGCRRFSHEHGCVFQLMFKLLAVRGYVFYPGKLSVINYRMSGDGDEVYHLLLSVLTVDQRQ